jgi:hypothetical protein
VTSLCHRRPTGIYLERHLGRVRDLKSPPAEPEFTRTGGIAPLKIFIRSCEPFKRPFSAVDLFLIPDVFKRTETDSVD